MSIEIVHTEKSEKAYKLTFQKLPGMMFVIQANELRDACRKSLKNGSIGGLTLASDYFNDHDPIDVSTGETTTSDYFLGMAISVGYIWDRSVNLALTFELRDAADFYDESLESVQVNALLHRGRNNNDKWSIQMGMAQGTVEAKYDSQKHGCQLDVKLNTPEMSEWNILLEAQRLLVSREGTAIAPTRIRGIYAPGGSNITVLTKSAINATVGDQVTLFS